MDSLRKEKNAKLNAWVKQDRLKFPDKYRNMDLLKNYGITLEEYNILLDKQNGVCAICYKEETARQNKSSTIRNLAVDHCHDSLKIRGLLCTACNQGLGNFKDNKDSLTKAIQYLSNAGP